MYFAGLVVRVRGQRFLLPRLSKRLPSLSPPFIVRFIGQLPCFRIVGLSDRRAGSVAALPVFLCPLVVGALYRTASAH